MILRRSRLHLPGFQGAASCGGTHGGSAGNKTTIFFAEVLEDMMMYIYIYIYWDFIRSITSHDFSRCYFWMTFFYNDLQPSKRIEKEDTDMIRPKQT